MSFLHILLFKKVEQSCTLIWDLFYYRLLSILYFKLFYAESISIMAISDYFKVARCIACCRMQKMSVANSVNQDRTVPRVATKAIRSVPKRFACVGADLKCVHQ